VYVKKPTDKDWVKLKLLNATADYSEPEQKSADAKKISGPVVHLIDGKDDTTWTADRGVGLRNQPSAAVVQFDHPLNLPSGTQLKVAWQMADMLGCGRLSLPRRPPPVALPVDHAAILALQTPPSARTSEQKDAIFAAWRMTV